MATKKETAAKIGASMIAGLEQMLATLKVGGIEAVKRKYHLPIPDPKPFELPAITRKDVVKARKSLGVSQSVFALILGASAQSVRAWEQGTKPPSGVARRLIGEIRDKPDYWRKRFLLEPKAIA